MKPPFFKQEKPHTCAVACLRMILDMYGLKIDEDSLSEKCGTTKYGTTASALVAAANGLGFDARKEHAKSDDLDQYLAKKIFPIIYINLLLIDGYNTTHAIVVEEITDSEAKILDPRIGSRTIVLELFKYSWQRAKNVTIIIEKPA